jgi:hypothetical protein
MMAVLAFAVPIAVADPARECPPDITGETVTGNIVVPHHQECTISDSVILGNILVEESADLHFVNTRLRGNVWLESGTGYSGDPTLVDFNGGYLNGTGGILTGNIGCEDWDTVVNIFAVSEGDVTGNVEEDCGGSH